jgi:CDP-diacylglycerol--glycerol-3-phosphate 3-phosphatidyltransferase
MTGIGAADWTASEGAQRVGRRVNARAIMDWPRFVQAWAQAYDGYDLRHTGRFARWWARLAYKCGLWMTNRGATAGALTATVMLAAVFVPVMAAGGGRWAFLAAVFVLVGVFSDAVGRAVSVLREGPVHREGFYRSLAERVGEVGWLVSALLLGAASVLVLACLALTAAHEYVRARATVSGLRPAGTSTVGDRALRIVATLVFLVIAGSFGPMHADLAAGTTTIVLALWVLLALFGFVQLLAVVRKALIG